ncbi:16785_t:CDS:2, partial [Entrophospora sp. SA101]
MPEEHYISDHISSKPGKPIPRSHTVVRRHAPKLGNPTPLGLSAFALSVMVVSFYNMQSLGVVVPNVVVGVSMFTGGVVQFAAGMWEFRVGNTFGGTGFSAFGGFWTSFGALYIPSFGIEKAFENHFR